MKDMSNRDKMIIIIITIIAILVAGFFALIRPKYKALVADTATFNDTQTEWNGIETKLNAIPGLKDSITKIYQESSSTAKLFVNEAFADANKDYDDRKVNVAVDEHLQPAIDESKLKVMKFDIKNTEATDVEYYYYTPNVVTYSLLEAADINGNYAQTINEELKTSTLIQERQVAEMLGQNISLSVSGTRENLMAFLDAIKSDEHAVIVESLDISDYQFNGGIEGEQVVEVRSVDEAGNEVVTQQVVGANGEPGTGTSGYLISVTFYNAKAVDVPDFGD